MAQLVTKLDIWKGLTYRYGLYVVEVSLKRTSYEPSTVLKCQGIPELVGASETTLLRY